MRNSFQHNALRTQTAFIFAETFLARLDSQAGADSDGWIKIAIIDKGNIKSFFAYTHEVSCNSEQSDEDVILEAFGKSSKYWADSRLKIVRAPNKNIDYKGKEPPKCWNTLPCLEATYYNYSETNPLRKNPSLEIPTMEPKSQELAL